MPVAVASTPMPSLAPMLKKVLPAVVSDAQAVQACRQFLDDHRMLVEPACGAALAALDQLPALLPALLPAHLQQVSRILVVVCGGVTATAASILG